MSPTYASSLYVWGSVSDYPVRAGVLAAYTLKRMLPGGTVPRRVRKSLPSYFSGNNELTSELG
jgi:hypothetical protein